MTNRPVDTRSWCSGESWGWREIGGVAGFKATETSESRELDRREQRALPALGPWMLGGRLGEKGGKPGSTTRRG